MLGKTIGRYQVTQQLGEGGMAIVYLAYDEHLETNVALKVIRENFINQDTTGRLLLRFESEAKRVARLSHPNIIPILDYGKFENTPYLVMKYIPGGTLKDRLGKKIPWREAVRQIIPIARALSYAHQQGIIHRDVKPANILMTETGEPMLSDFGIAKMILSEETDVSTGITGTSMVLGTPDYMAPEQAYGKPIDARIDIYALGLILYEMITGKAPFTADTPMAVIMKHISEPPLPPGQLVPGLPQALEKAVLRSLEKEPEDRFPTMAAFCATLEQLVQSGPMAPAGQETGVKPAPAITSTMVEPAKGVTPKTPAEGIARAPVSWSKPIEKPADTAGERIPEQPEKRETFPQPWKRWPRIWFIAGGAGIIGLLCLVGVIAALVINAQPWQKTPAVLSESTGLPTATVELTGTFPTSQTGTEVTTPSNNLSTSQSPEVIQTEQANSLSSTLQAQSTEEARGLYDTVRDLNTQGLLSGLNGTYHRIDDFSESWAQIGFYKYWKIGYTPSNFVIRAHTAWESASDQADWYESGCGFVFRAKDENNHYMIYLALDGNIYLTGYVNGELRDYGKAPVADINPMNGEADVMLVNEGSQILYFVNGSKVLQVENSDLTEGALALTLISGTDKDFGTRCTMSNIELWDLSGQ